MHYVARYVVDDSGLLRWSEGVRIHDEQMKAAYRQNVVIEFVIETFACMGVKTGMA